TDLAMTPAAPALSAARMPDSVITGSPEPQITGLSNVSRPSRTLSLGSSAMNALRSSGGNLGRLARGPCRRRKADPRTRIETDHLADFVLAVAKTEAQLDH